MRPRYQLPELDERFGRRLDSLQQLVGAEQNRLQPVTPPMYRLTPAQRQELHRRTAQQLQQDAAPRVAELAYHFDAAGDSQFALPYAMQAAEQARAQHALEVAKMTSWEISVTELWHVL